MYTTVPELRGIWGLEDRPYAIDEIRASSHLTCALQAGALILVDDPVPATAPVAEHTKKRKEV